MIRTVGQRLCTDMELEKKQQLEADGYTVIPDFLNDADVAALRKECWNIVEDMNPAEHHTVFSTVSQSYTSEDYFAKSGDKIRFFFESEALNDKGELQVDKHRCLNKIGHALHVFSPEFKRITFSQKIKDVVKSLGMIDPIVCQSMYIFKPPDIGGEVIPHQDSTFLYTTPMKLFGLWIALEDATLENGCLWFIPGSQKEGLYGDRRMVINTEKPGFIYRGTQPPADDKRYKPAEVKKGSLVVIHGEVLHKSEPNLSTKSRHIYTFHVYDQHETEYSKENWLQPTEAKTFTPLYTFA